MAVKFETIGNAGLKIENPSPDKWLKELPSGFLPFADFQREFNLEATSTEQLHPVTRQLSQAMNRNVSGGLELLLAVDKGVIEGVERFSGAIAALAPLLSEKFIKGGRIFLVGSGSSGRVGIDIAAQCKAAFREAAPQIEGVIAGGDSAMIRAKEGFEDSEADGMKALEKYHVGPLDTVILISASGSASFNVGCGHHSADRGANVLYFYNSESIPERTRQLFVRQRNPVTPLCVDIGPQAISGSTRLQGATLAEAGLGALLVSALHLVRGEEKLAAEYPKALIRNMREGIGLIRAHLAAIAKFVSQEHGVFSDPRSNFRQLVDLTERGYITLIALKNCIRAVLIDSTETSPTFSTNPIRREYEGNRKRAEFRAYLHGVEHNDEAWKAVLGREINPEDIKDTEAFILSSEADGLNSYAKRSKGAGNLSIGVAKIGEGSPFPTELIEELAAIRNTGGQIGLVLLCRGKLTAEQLEAIKVIKDACLLIESVPYDTAGFSETIVLKQVLNLISNGSMLLMNKVHGNQMIDVRASNRKLIDRCIRLVKAIWSEFHPGAVLKDEELYHYVAHVSAIKKSYEQQGTYTPSVVKIILAMLALKKTPKDFLDVVSVINKNHESIEWISDSSRTVPQVGR